MDKKSSEDLARVEPINRTPSVSKGSIMDADDKRLRAQGHKAELERSLSWLGALSLAYSITNSWLTYAASFGLVLIYGGGVTTVFALFIAAAAQWIVFLGLGELCSAFPSSGGQYHFTYIIASPNTRNFGASDIKSISAIWVSRSYLRYLDFMTESITGFSLIGMVLTIAVCLGMADGDYAPGTILLENRGISGWNAGTGWLLSIAAAIYCFAGNGAVAHIAEELPDPGRKLPQVLNMSMAMGIVIVVPWTVAMLYSIKYLAAVQSSFLPSFEMFYQATGSKAAATGLQAYLTFLYYITQGRDKLPRRAFSLGKFGYAVNLYSVVFMIVIGVVFCLPQTNPTTAGSMNYNAPVIVGLFTVICLLWIERRSKFNGPHIDWDLLNEAIEEE
ncbi:HNM1-choline permease [Fusarium circinatum]|uniref:HNM1-choline permease n=1 Tax=Fusarium circinatum TaxID=48490 RepID=A0A8H5TL67_FUSCI|nr:HNM1-choline permease [Fusarium circinatum]